MKQTVFEYIRAHLLASVGICGEIRQMPSLERIREIQWSPRFEELRLNRMVLGAFRYRMLDQYQKRGSPYDNIGSLIQRAQAYQATGNLEYLVDIANLAMIEFEIGRHPKRHFHSADDGEHTQKKGSG